MECGPQTQECVAFKGGWSWSSPTHGLGEFAADENFTLELLELLHPHEIRRNLTNGGWRRVSLRILIALLSGGVVLVAEES